MEIIPERITVNIVSINDAATMMSDSKERIQTTYEDIPSLEEEMLTQSEGEIHTALENVISRIKERVEATQTTLQELSDELGYYSEDTAAADAFAQLCAGGE